MKNIIFLRQLQIIVEIAKHANLDIQKQTNCSCFHVNLDAQQCLSNHSYQNWIGEDDFSLLTQQQFEQFVNHHNPSLRLFAANSLLLTPNQVKQLVNDSDPHVRASMVLSPLLTVQQFTQLSKDEHYMVKGLTASSQFITMDKMEYLIQYGNFYIKNSIVRSPYLDEYPNLVEILKSENDKRILKLLDYIGL